MAQPHSEARVQFSQPVRQILMMLMALGLSGFGAFVALPRVLPVSQPSKKSGFLSTGTDDPRPQSREGYLQTESRLPAPARESERSRDDPQRA